MPGARRITRTPSGNSGKIVTLGIDPSLTAYAMVAYFPETGTHLEWLITTPAEGDLYARRLLVIKTKVVQVVTDLDIHHDLRLIVIERPAYAASGAFTGGLVHAATALGMLQALGPEDQRLHAALPASNTLKKFVTGKGVGKKQLMVKFVYQKWDYDTTDDNLADAYGLARLGAAVLYGSEHKYEQECVDTVRRSMTWDPLPPPSTPNLKSSPKGEASRSSGKAPRKSSSVSATPVTSSNSRRASRSRSETPRRSRSGV